MADKEGKLCSVQLLTEAQVRALLARHMSLHGFAVADSARMQSAQTRDTGAAGGLVDALAGRGLGTGTAKGKLRSPRRSMTSSPLGLAEQFLELLPGADPATSDGQHTVVHLLL
jgi:hypothetical protein